MEKTKSRDLKRIVLNLFSAGDLDRALGELTLMPARKVINPLFSFLLSTDPRIKWSAVTAMGAVVAPLADREPESARVIMRRFMWQLNDESGGIGWGCPESMGEICACHEGLAQEYAPVLVSYVNEEGNFLEYEPLQPGAVWGIGRAAQVRPHTVQKAAPHLLPFLKASNPVLRGLAAWTLGLLGEKKAGPGIESLLLDDKEIEIFRDRKLRHIRVKNLAEEAWMKLK